MENIYYQLLDEINLINKKYETILNRSGENFNVFKILEVEANETRLHSAFLAELLNPNGSHGRGDIFLKLFLSALSLNSIDFQTEDAKVIIEKYIGRIDDHKTNDGRIDISIEDIKGNRIFIENKIFAGDQENQMIRYHNHDPKAKLFYLTLDGHEPSEWSKGSLIEGVDFWCIDYRFIIQPWLEECRKEAVEFPILRESITQYIHLIKHLTNQTINENMNQELITIIIKDKNYLSAAFSIYSTVDAACDQLLQKLEELAKEIASELDLQCDFHSNGNNYFTIYFYKSNWKLSSIAFQYQNKHHKLAFGILRDEPVENLKDHYGLKLSKQLESLNGYPEPWWPIKVFVESPYDDWDINPEPWLAIVDGTIKLWMKNKVKTVLDLLGNTEL